jgi:chromosomal replication initiation ATPase DnaA
VTPALVLSTTACVYGLAPAVLRSRDRSVRVAEARAVAAFLAYELTGASYRDVGAELERDKGTVCRIVDHLSRRLGRRDRRLTDAVGRVESELVALYSPGSGNPRL